MRGLSMRPWKELTWTDLLILGTSASTAAGALYLLMAGDEEELTLGDANGGPSSKQDTLTSKQTVIQVKIPKEAAGHVIGQQGIVIKQVQAESGARIHFKDEVATDTERILMVRGNQESAQKAEMMIKQIIHDIPEVHTIDLFVPQRFLGRLIGKNGDNIRNLQRSSKARIVIERSSDEKDPKAKKKVTLSGSAEQIDLARGLIEEQLEEDEAFRKKQQIAADARTKKNVMATRFNKGHNNGLKHHDRRWDSGDGRGINNGGSDCHATGGRESSGRISHGGGGDCGDRIRVVDGAGDSRNCAIAHDKAASPRQAARRSDECPTSDVTIDACNAKPSALLSPVRTIELPDHSNYFEVYVSALDVKEANRIWIQLFSKADKLNLLNQKLDDFYNSRDNQEDRLKKFKVAMDKGKVGTGIVTDDQDKDRMPLDRLVAAKLNAYSDSKWFRARILSMTGDKVEVYYVDYGDVAFVPFTEVRRLRREFADEIPFQAVECLIAGITAPPVVTSMMGNKVEDGRSAVVGANTADSADADSIAGFVSQLIDDVESHQTESNGHAKRLPPGMSTVNTSTTKTQPSNNGWTDAALDFVDEVTRNAQWELLYAKVVDFVEEAPSGRRIPRIELVDTNGDGEVDIATAIVEAGHAVWSDENRS